MSQINSGELVPPPETIYRYPKEFVDVQVDFASRLSRLGGQPLAFNLLNYTFLYKQIVGQKYKPDQGIDPLWNQMISTVDFTSTNITDSVFRFYTQQKRSHLDFIMPNKNGIGVNAIDESTVELHVSRLNFHFPIDLTRTIQSLREGGIKYLYTCSWLNDLCSQDNRFKKFFPPSYFEKMVLDDSPGFRGIFLWGQFVGDNHSVNHKISAQFSQSISKATSVDEAKGSFPYKVKSVTIPISDFP